jgi:hypothetical protein
VPSLGLKYKVPYFHGEAGWPVSGRVAQVLCLRPPLFFVFYAFGLWCTCDVYVLHIVAEWKALIL